jgi:hypothetical protein
MWLTCSALSRLSDELEKVGSRVIRLVKVVLSPKPEDVQPCQASHTIHSLAPRA